MGEDLLGFWFSNYYKIILKPRNEKKKEQLLFTARARSLTVSVINWKSAVNSLFADFCWIRVRFVTTGRHNLATSWLWNTHTHTIHVISFKTTFYKQTLWTPLGIQSWTLLSPAPLFLLSHSHATNLKTHTPKVQPQHSKEMRFVLPLNLVIILTLTHPNPIIIVCMCMAEFSWNYKYNLCIYNLSQSDSSLDAANPILANSKCLQHSFTD